MINPIPKVAFTFKPALQVTVTPILRIHQTIKKWAKRQKLFRNIIEKKSFFFHEKTVEISRRTREIASFPRIFAKLHDESDSRSKYKKKNKFDIRKSQNTCMLSPTRPLTGTCNPASNRAKEWWSAKFSPLAADYSNGMQAPEHRS